MKLRYVGALIGLLVSVTWITFGFWKMIVIVISIGIGISFGAWLDLQGWTFKSLLVKLLDKLTN